MEILPFFKGRIQKTKVDEGRPKALEPSVSFKEITTKIKT